MEKFIVANWKMNKGSVQDLNYLRNIAKIPISPSLTVIIAPPYTLISLAQQALQSAPFYLGAQDCSTEDNGAHTGDISASILKECGCAAVIIGHSERRQHHKETSEIVRKKAQIASENGLLPIICIGETLEEYQAGKTFSILRDQIEESIPRKDFPFCLAYEPVWAIGSGKTPALEEINAIHADIKKNFRISKPVLYGGSVTSDNTKEILSLSNVDGLLVGGSSLDFQEFEEILKKASS